MSTKARDDCDWRCENPECFCGALFARTGPRTMVGIGAWCLECKGGTDISPGMGWVKRVKADHRKSDKPREYPRRGDCREEEILWP